MSGATPPAPPPDRLPLPLLLRVFLPFAAGYFLSYLYRSVNAVISPDLVRDLGLDAGDLGLLTSIYFLTFALFQLPLGLLLDRFGARRVEAVLLLVAALGALLFALSTQLAGLIVGRALIGLGVSACLMAAFTAFVGWFPAPRLPAVNGWVMAAGGLGALTATAPVEAVLRLSDWRSLFLGLSGITVLVAALLWRVVPERAGATTGTSLRDQWQGVARIFRDRYFWRLAPLPSLSQSTFMAIQGLWAGPWLRDVAGLERVAVANHLLLAATGMAVGYPLLGWLAYRLSRAGIPPLWLAAAGMLLFMLLQLLLVLGVTGAPALLWLLFGFCGTAGTLVYAVLSQAFPPALAGRVNTALNLLVFLTAFIAQWGLGAIINQWPVTARGYHPHGYQAAFAVALGLQALAFCWLLPALGRSGR
jgi:MFS family permease